MALAGHLQGVALGLDGQLLVLQGIPQLAVSKDLGIGTSSRTTNINPPELIVRIHKGHQHNGEVTLAVVVE